VFLFVIDSLRRDYLSAYNPAVDFSPAIGKFAKDSFVFERAFTRYGGTGLAVPSIWTGGMLLHKMYVTPFNPMNALLKMLDADRYRRVMSMDSIVTQLMDPPPQDDELDRGVPIMDYRLCTTFEELQGKLKPVGTGEARHRERRPVFAYSLPQDLHISHIRSRVIPPGRSYAGFVPQVAAQVEEIDGCFGRFVEFLKENDLYERSVIIITADHGDSLGEGLRWGHSYTMFPEVARIPLIMRVPEAFRRGLTVDPGAVAFSTDLTPTIYALAGHHPADLGPLYGRPLLVEHDRDLSPRRTDPHLITSSYGGVYGVVTDNGSRLYIADGVNQRDYAYELGPQSTKRVGVTVAEREANRSFIRQQIEELARSYGFTPRT
jgi:arylsulfatase A-like enzyme